ncbi:hypothetical protein D3C77_217720 [compost metagenome]
MSALADSAAGLIAVHDRHVAVHQDKVERCGMQLLQCLGAVGGDVHFATQFGQHALGHQLIHRIVFHQQNACAAFAEQGTVVCRQVGAVIANQSASQGLVQGVACQGTGLLLKRRQLRRLFAGEKVAVGGHQQNRRRDLRTQAEQTVQVIGDQKIGCGTVQFVGAVVALIIQSPVG